MKPQPQTFNRPLSHVPTALLFKVVNRGLYPRYHVALAQQLQAELAVRRLVEKRSN